MSWHLSYSTFAIFGLLYAFLGIGIDSIRVTKGYPTRYRGYGLDSEDILVNPNRPAFDRYVFFVCDVTCWLAWFQLAFIEAAFQGVSSITLSW